MRLKFLFFPIILVISITIFVVYIWPEITNVRTLNQNKLASMAALNGVREKQAAIEKIGDQIASDNSGQIMVNTYLPAQKSEERIISGINFLAADSGVSLVNISLKDVGGDASVQNVTANPNAIANMVGNVSPLASTTTSAAAGADTKTAVNALQLSEATISISGDYDKIKLFVDQLQRMSIYNSIKSFIITSSQQDDKGNKSDQVADPSQLSANIIMDFGYLPTVAITDQKIANFNPSIDSDTISALKQYVSQKTPSVDSIGDSNGKMNPFLP